MFDFDDDVLDQLDAVAHPQQEPVLVCFYSGGFFHADGCKLVADVLSAAAQVGIGDSLVLGFPDHYEIEDEGNEWWEGYVDRLVDEIDSQEAYRGRPIILFGHSRGACPAMSLATRLGSRVLKVYIAACGPIAIGRSTPWEDMSKAFKQNGDKALIGWFSSLQPGNLLLKRTADLPEKDIPVALAESVWLGKLVKLMRLQYRDATFPRMTGDSPDIQVVGASLWIGVATQDNGASKETMQPWASCTRGRCEFVACDQGHMDCLTKGGEMLTGFAKDIAQFVPA